jgi:hypothetical protein
MIQRALLLAILIGCGPSGSDPYSQLTEHRAPGGEYVVRYLRPPWQPGPTSGSSASFFVQSDGMARYDAGLPKYLLLVTVEPGDAASRAMAEMSAALSRGETLEVAPRLITTREAVNGWELVTRRSTSSFERNFRYVYLPSGSSVVRLYFDASAPIATREIEAMIQSVDVAPL